MDRAVKQSNSQLSLSHRHHHHHQNAGRSVFSKRSRYHGSNPNHHFSQQEHQQQQSSPNHSHSSSSSNNNNNTSRGNKRSPFSDQNQKFSFKLGGRWNSHQGHNSEGIERMMIYPTERIRASPSLAARIISSDASSMVCALCNDLLGHNPENHRPRSSGLLLIEEPCVVAVLVCGHAFHADCLERATLVKDARDPPCPSCSCWSAKAQDA